MKVFGSITRFAGYAYRGCVRDGWLLPISLAIPLLTVALMFAYPPATLSVERYVSLSALPDIEDIFARRLADLSDIAADLSRSETVQRYLNSPESDDLLSALAADQVQQRSVGNIIFADPAGYTRGQSILTLRRGDHLPRVTRWGSVLAQKGSVSMLSSCPVAPLILVGGAATRAGGVIVGQAYAVDYLDDAYAHRLRDTYLPAGSEVAFVRLSEGITGSSFSPDTGGQVLDVFVENIRLRLDQDTFPEHIRIGDSYYFLKTIPLDEDGVTIGYVLIFVPSLDDSIAIVFACLVALAFFAIHMGTHELRDRRPGYSDVHGVVIAAIAVLVFAGSFGVIGAVLKSAATDIRDPGFTIYNSTMKLVPESGAVHIGSEIRVGIEIQTGGEAINVASARIEFDPEQVHIAEINMEHSFCDPQFVIARDIDNVHGAVTVSCGVTGKQGISGVGSQLEFAELVAVPRAEGPFSLHIAEDTHVLASDGLGTEVLRATTDGYYRAFTRDSADSGALEIASLSHPNSARWYSEPDVSLLFLPATTTVRYALTQSATSRVPDDAPRASGNVRISVPEDGTFYVRARAAGSTLPSAAPYVLHIDTTPPDPPIIDARTLTPARGEVVQFEFSSSDATSGLQPIFYISLDGGMFWPVGQSFLIPFMTSGTHTVTVRAFDRAGNYSDASVAVDVR